jgi:hypothetical protein
LRRTGSESALHGVVADQTDGDSELFCSTLDPSWRTQTSGGYQCTQPKAHRRPQGQGRKTRALGKLFTYNTEGRSEGICVPQDVKIYRAYGLTQLLRVYAPENPFDDKTLQVRLALSGEHTMEQLGTEGARTDNVRRPATKPLAFPLQPVYRKLSASSYGFSDGWRTHQTHSSSSA